MSPHHLLAFCLPLALVASSSVAHADEEQPTEAPAETSASRNGGYGAPSMKVTTIAGSPGLLFGSEGGWIVNHWFVLGGAGYGLINDVTQTTNGVKSAPISLGYGGLRLGVILGSQSVVHFSGGVLLGGAGVSIGDDGESTGTFVIEPDAAAEINLARWVRLAIGGSYRMMPGGDGGNLRFAQISGPAAGVAVKLGKF
jgi:hypothetical protein